MGLGGARLQGLAHSCERPSCGGGLPGGVIRCARRLSPRSSGADQTSAYAKRCRSQTRTERPLFRTILSDARSVPGTTEWFQPQAASGRIMLTLKSRFHPPKNGGTSRRVDPNLAAEWAPRKREKYALVSE